MEGLAIIALVIATIWIITIIRKQIKITRAGVNLLQDFENRMASRGFTKRLVVYDFFSERHKRQASPHWYTVGLWFNYPEKLIALRLDRDTWKEVIVPFGIIREYDKDEGVDIIDHPFIDHSGLTGGGGISKKLHIKIVTGDIQTGITSYVVKLYDPMYGAKLKISDPIYKSILECKNAIYYELNNIISFNQRNG